MKEKPEILLLTHRVPFPPNRGDKIRSYNILKRLMRTHTVHIGCLVENDNEENEAARLAQCINGSLVFERVTKRDSVFQAARSFLTGQAITHAFFYSSALQKKVDALIRDQPIGLMFCYSSTMAEYYYRSKALSQKADLHTAMDLIDVDSAKWRDVAKESPVYKRWLYEREYQALQKYESSLTHNFDHVYITSEAERTELSNNANLEKVVSMTNGVDCEFFSPTTKVMPHQCSVPTIVFTGVMDYAPNADAAVWFAHQIFPAIREVYPDAVFQIVGARPQPKVRKLATLDGVIVTGYVDDVRLYLQNASVCVVPLRIARGIQNKVLEAMASQKPIVATPAALTGIRGVAGKDFLSADGENQFATAVLRILGDPSYAFDLAKHARRTALREHRWDAALAPLDSLIAQV